MDPLSQALAIEQLILQLVPLIGQAYQAATSGDQATLDRLQAQAIAASDALRPPGASAEVVVATGA